MTFFELFRRSKAAAPTPAPASGTDAILESAPDPDEELLRYPPFMKGLPASDVDALLAKQTELIRRLQDGVGMTDTGYRELVLPVVRRRDPWARDPARRRGASTPARRASRPPENGAAGRPSRRAEMGLGGGRQMHEGRDPLILATIGQRYRFELLHPGQPLELEPRITLGPKGDMPVRLHRRTPVRKSA